jgi:translation initiation factor IF-2
MAKKRVYELARELNMTNKVLLDKINDLNIPASHHTSTLEEEDEQKIRAAELGTPPSDEFEEKRIKPTIIRRRKVITRKKAKPEVEVEAEESAEALPEAKAPTEPETPVEAPVEEAKPKKVTKKAKKAFESAKVVAKPAAKTAKKTKKKAVPKKTAPEVEPTKAKPEEAETTPTEIEAPPEVEAEKEKEQTEATEKVKSGKAKKSKTAKTVKRTKVDAPAKIIKLGQPPAKPEPKVVRTKKKGKAAGAPEVKSKRELGPNASPADAGKKRGKKHGGEEVKDRKFFKKKISFRKKAVIEGDALYSGKFKKGRKRRRGEKAAAARGQKTQITTPKAIKRRIKIDEAIILAELGKRMGIKAGEMIKKLMEMGVMATVNQTIDFDTAVLVAAEFGFELEKASFEEETVMQVTKDDPEKMVGRSPVVTIMGHVDHGKTSLLDAIRKTHVTDTEAGGITQHIGAYNVTTDKGPVVFLDTPGHEAFTAMRARGAKVTDIVVLVVAADDGVMPQTTEAINHSRAAEVPIIVAVNKIDKANADIDRVQRELSEAGLTSEAWGGDTIFVNVSAKKREGLDELLEMILLQAELLELKANPDKLASGRVIEAKLDSGRGPVATVLVQEGTLHAGDAVVCGVHYGKVRALLDDHRQQVESAGPAMPVEIVGLTGVPQAGDELTSLADEKDAKQVSNYRTQKQRSKELARTSRVSLENLFENIQEGEIQELNLILKADVHGSIEALKDSLTKLSNEEVKINVVHTATGAINESDISLAAVSNAIILGFNVRPSAKFTALANEENVDMRFYSVIYDVITDVKNAIVGMMSSTYKEHVLGHADVRETFHVPKTGTIAGCMVTDGKVERDRPARLIREGVVVYDGKIVSLRRFKDDAREVQNGYECGIGIENYNDIKVGDVIECYYLEEIKPEIA